MKKFLGLMLAILVSSQGALASQYAIYVTGSTHVSPAQAELATLVQKNILVDSETKTLTLLLASPCGNARCPQIVRAISLNLTNLTLNRSGLVTTVNAEGVINLRGKPSQAIVEITLNPDNSMDIAITNSSDCKSTHSNFIGSPATLNTL